MRIDVHLKRVYEPADRSDGYRVLVERLGRGISHRVAKIDEWARDLAPTDSLRRWYGHQPDLFAEFRRRYLRELNSKREPLSVLRGRARAKHVTLVLRLRTPT